MKKRKINIIILLLALALVLYFTLKDNFSGVILELSRVNIIIFIISILIFVISLLFKTISLHVFIKTYKNNYSFKKTFELTLMGQFLNGVTPFQSGGQPFQVYLLRKDGFRISDSTSAMVKDFISFQITLILMGLFAIFANRYFNIIPGSSYTTFLISIGFIINVVVLVFLFVIISAKASSLKIINKILDFLLRFKFIKRFKISKEKIILGLEHFYEGGNELRNDKKNLVISIFANAVNLVLLYSIPFLIFKSLGCDSITITSSVVVTSFVMLIGNFIPIPGATGGIEYGFISFFGNFSITSSVLSGAMLLWRFVTYFFGMLIGFITLALKEGVDKK